MHPCPFKTVAKEELSPFYSLFSQKGFETYEYAEGPEKSYTPGTHHVLSLSRHKLFVRQVWRSSRCRSRCRVHQPAHQPSHESLCTPQPTTNSTLLSSPLTFPLDRVCMSISLEDRA